MRPRQALRSDLPHQRLDNHCGVDGASRNSWRGPLARGGETKAWNKGRPSETGLDCGQAAESHTREWRADVSRSIELNLESDASAVRFQTGLSRTCREGIRVG